MGRAGLGMGVGTAVGEGSGGRVSSAGGGSGVAGMAGLGVTVGVGWPRMRETGAHGARTIGATRSRPTIRQVSITFRYRFDIVSPVGDSNRG